MIQTKGYAVQKAGAQLTPFTFERREPGERDVQIQILYCGICHTDLHQAHDDWGNALFPMVPGHEIVGKVTATGNRVTKVKAGDLAGVGCLVDSCRHCASCSDGLEQYCEEGATLTYNSRERGKETLTFGGYSDKIVVDEHFVLKIPGSLDTKAVAPLMCAGITTYSPLRHWNVGKGQRIGIVGLGGLGHMAVKLGRALGAQVCVVTSSQAKVNDAKRLGADETLLSTDRQAMTRQAGSFHFLLDTIPRSHDLNGYVNLLRRDGTLVVVGALTALEPPLVGQNLILRRRTVAGSVIGGLAETQEMLDFCGEHKIVSDVEVVPIQGVNEAWKRLQKNDVRYRFVIDMASLNR